VNPPGHDIALTEADRSGVPVAAECECGGWRWSRPEGDLLADTLPTAARAHHQTVRRHARLAERDES
jgi:hypothetical protein